MVPRFDIDFMESVSPLMGEAIHRFNVEEQLRENYQSLQESEQRLKALNETLGQRAEQLRRLAAEVTRAEQRERRRLAALLHDNLQQLLVATKFSIRSLRRLTSDEEICRVAGEAGDILDQAIAESKSLTMELSPPILHQGGLAPALRWLGSWMHQKHGLTVNVQVDDDAIGEGGDVAVSLFSAARELLLNVVKHAGVHRARVRLARQDDQHVQLVVADKGAGFDPAQTIEGKIASGGFGLFNIRERLALLGGRLEVESTPGRGSRFTLVVPVRRPTARVERPAAAGLQAQLMAQPAADAQAELIGALGRKIRILLADDHTVVRQGLARLLQEEADMEVVGEAADGYTAVELARSSHPDVVVMDVTMSGLSGIEATRVITGELPHVRVIGLSMHEEEDMALEMRRAGAAAYVTKAGATDTLVAAIRAATAVLHGPETP
jgi:signal transduction histidine kinase/ActR/RegA family two-component response regulator